MDPSELLESKDDVIEDSEHFWEHQNQSTISALNGRRGARMRPAVSRGDRLSPVVTENSPYAYELDDDGNDGNDGNDGKDESYDYGDGDDDGNGGDGQVSMNTETKDRNHEVLEMCENLDSRIRDLEADLCNIEAGHAGVKFCNSVGMTLLCSFVTSLGFWFISNMLGG